MIGRAVWLWLAVPACFHPSYDHPACGPERACPDGLVCASDGFCGGSSPIVFDSGTGAQDDGMMTTADAGQCFGTGLLKLCLAAAPSGSKTLGAITLDTGNAAGCTEVVPQGGGVAGLCVIAASTIDVTGALVATGTRPLVLIAARTLTVENAGVIDVSSKTNGGARRGAAANTGLCTALNHGMSDAGGGGGGAGGSFATLGGTGGTGDTNNNGAPAGTAPGASTGLTHLPTVLVGGCPGSTGGGASENAVVLGGAGGDGGGAVYVIAGEAITVSGSIFASGAGGAANAGTAGAEQGGGGGGTGGMIGLDAPMIVVTGRVAANGGGGGGGGSIGSGGAAGGDGTTTSWNTRASGGAGNQNASGDGGAGAQGTAINQSTNLDGGDSVGGGGGGAGGLGLIWTYGGTIAAGAMISPTPVPH